jgi:septum formation protein
VLADRPHAILLAADTVVSHERQALGKPVDAADAIRLLQALRGRRHEVITAVCLARSGHPPLTAASHTAVWMRPYSDAEIAAYVATGDPFDKAGAYAIQHPQFRPVARLVGSYTNVVGLPISLVADLLRAVGLTPSPTASLD